MLVGLFFVCVFWGFFYVVFVVVHFGFCGFVCLVLVWVFLFVCYFGVFFVFFLVFLVIMSGAQSTFCSFKFA